MRLKDLSHLTAQQSLAASYNACCEPRKLKTSGLYASKKHIISRDFFNRQAKLNSTRLRLSNSIKY